METLKESTVRELLEYYYFEAELDGGIDWDELDRRMHSLKMEWAPKIGQIEDPTD